MANELFEWGAAEVFGGELGEAYLGTQGDPWDAHRDMALAGLGALMAAGVALLRWGGSGERRPGEARAREHIPVGKTGEAVSIGPLPVWRTPNL